MGLLAFGEILWDVYPCEKYLGGATFNFAAHFSKLGGKSFVVSALGNDELGKEALKITKSFGIDTRFISTVNKKTGRCDVTLDENKIPSYNLLNNVAYDFISTEGINGSFDTLYFGTLALRNEYNKKSLQSLLNSTSFENVFVDVNIRPPFYSKEAIEFAVKNATIIKISDEELNTVAANLGIVYKDINDFAAKLCKLFTKIKTVIITLGDKGAFAFDKNNNLSEFCTAKKVKVASTVGAGDSFGAAFLYSYLKGLDVASCLKNASNLAAFVVSRKDAVPEYEENIF